MATQAELAQGYNDFINAITSGNFGEAANVAAGLGFSPAETEAFIEANAPGLGFDPGIDIPSDVIAGYFDAPPVSYGPPSPAVSPVVSNPVSLTPAGIAALAPSANVPSPANVFSPADYGPPSPIFDPAAEIQRMQAQRVEAERLKQIELERPIVDPRPQPTVDPVDQQAGGLLNQYYAAIDAGDIRTARNLLSQAQTIYGPETLTNVAQDMLSRLNQTMTQAKTTGDFTGAAKLVEAAGEIYGGDALQNIADYLNTDLQLLNANEGVRFTPKNLVQFIQQGKIPAAQTEPVTPEGAAAPPTAQTTPGPGQIYGIPRFERQAQSNVPFAPLRRGLAQLRPAMYMPGLTSGQAPLGGSGFTPESLRTANQGLSLADRAYQMDVGGVSPAELSAAIGTPVGQLQAEYNQLRPKGLFSTGVPAPRGLPEDFALQTGAYGAPTPTFLALPEKKTATSAAETPLPSGSTQNTDTGSEYIATDREGGLIKMAEGGGPPKMAELSAAKAGSTFDISKYIDDEGRLVGGMSKPIRDAYGKIIGYESGDLPLPIQRDVVFNPILARREEEERERMRNMAEGGLANVAQNLADRGRKGDSMLVHMAPEEVAGLRALARAQGTDMTINPRTGLPEAFSLRKLFKAASFILPFIPIPGLFGMSSLLTKSILSGVAAGASAKGGFDFKQALGGGLRAYALGSLGEKMGGAPTPDGAPTVPTTTVGEAAGAVDAAAVSAPQVTVPGVDGDISLAGSYTGRAIPASLPGAPQYEFSVQGPDVGGAGVSVPISLDAPFSPGDPTVPRPEGTPSFVTPEGQGFGKPITKGFDIAAAGIGGLSLEKAAEEQRKYDMEATAIRQEDEERKRRFDELFARTLGSVRTAKAGGTINLAKGGMSYMEGGGTTDVTGEPRMVQGMGDGMSDSVPATIEGVQEARLANDEFVIPADVVADIGNGSSNAGAKKLYNAMDRIRKARHGTTKQPPEIRAERLMPA
jgi:hypothetical protein